jgi:hypothetical protein
MPCWKFYKKIRQSEITFHAQKASYLFFSRLIGRGGGAMCKFDRWTTYTITKQTNIKNL